MLSDWIPVITNIYLMQIYGIFLKQKVILVFLTELFKRKMYFIRIKLSPYRSKEGDKTA